VINQAGRSSLRPLYLLAAAIVLLEAIILALVLPLQPGGFALQFIATPRGFGEIIHVWSPEQLARYRSHLPVDGLLLLAYGSFGWLCVQRVSFYQRLRPWVRRCGAALLPLAAAFDAVENSLHWWLTEVPRFGLPGVYLASASCAALKWLLVLGFAAFSLWALARQPE
jgi:hypothetical protein